MWTSWNGRTGRGNSFDPPEPPSDEWFEEHCPKCKYNHEWQENGEWYGECTEGCCTGFVEREEDDET